MKLRAKKSGYTLVEMIIYVSILSVITLLIAQTVFSFTTSYRTVAVLRAVDNSAIDVMERITRDVREGTSITDANSTFASNPGVLTIVGTSGGSTKTTKFYLQNGVVKVDVNGSYFGPLTLSSTTVSSLVFYKIDNGVSDSVKVDLTVSATLGAVTKTKTYHSTVILKGY